MFQSACTAEREGLIEAVEHAADGIVITDTNGKIQYVNPAFTTLTGYSKEDAIGQNPRLLKSGRHSSVFYEDLWSTILSGEVWRGVMTNRRKDGTLYDEEMQIAPFKDSDGTTTGFIAIKHDVTELRALQQAQSLLSAIVEGSDDAMIACTLTGTIVAWNRGAERTFGYFVTEAVGKHVSMLMAPERLRDLNYLQGQILQGINVSQYESLCVRRDGSLFYASVSGSPTKNSTGTVVSMSAVFRDMTRHHMAELELRASERRFHEVFEYAPVGIYVAGPDERFVQVNEAFCKMVGRRETELLTMAWVELCASDERSAALSSKQQLWQDGTTRTETERRYVRSDGTIVLCKVKISLLRDADGVPLCSVIHVEDMSRRKHAENALQESEGRFRSMANGSLMPMWVSDAKGRIQFVNCAFHEYCGNTQEQVEEINWQLLLHPDDLPAFRKEIDRALWSHTTFKAEARLRRADGEWRWLIAQAQPRFSPDGEFLGQVGLTADITERKEAEQALLESEDRFRTMADACPSMMWVTGVSGEAKFLNRAYQTYFGTSCDEIRARKWHLQIHPDDSTEYVAAFDHALKEQTTFRSDARVLRADGEWRLMGTYAEPRLSPTGEYMGLVGLCADITERKSAEQAMRRSEEKFRQLAENITEVFWMMNVSGTEILYISPAYEEIWGRSCKSLYDAPMDWIEAINPEDRELAHETFMRQLQGEKIDSEYRIHTPDGIEKWIRDRAFPVRGDDGHILRVAGIAEDITERKRAEQTLRRSEEKFRQLAESIREVFRIIPIASDESLYVSPAYEQIWGRSLESIYQNPASWLEAVHPDDREYAEPIAVKQMLGQRIEAEYRICTPDGTEKWIRDRAFPIRDLAGQLIGVAGIAEEITEQKNYEIDLILARKQADAANQAKGDFLANMSHEIRTPMNGIIGMNGLLLDTTLTAEQRCYAEIARSSGESLLRLINDILDFSKIEARMLELETIDFDLRNLLDDFASIFSTMARAKGIELVSTVDPAVPLRLRGDPGRLRQVLTNLTGNAIKFTEKGAVAVYVELEEDGESSCLLRISVRDTGIGIPEDKIGELFSEFSQVDRSTTRKYGGTGLGLAISRRLAEMMGGAVGVTSREGVGSDFWFTVRLGQSLSLGGQSDEARCQSQPTNRLKGKILIAEDNSTNRLVALGMLGKLGLRADAVADGVEAISALRAIPYDLVLMDVRMPVMDGIEATRQIRNPKSKVLNHDIPIIAMTADAMQSDRDTCHTAGMNDFVPKPVSMSLLQDVLRKWLPSSVVAPAMLLGQDDR